MDGAPWPGAVAVSGGSDSLALMLLLRDWALEADKPLPVVFCVDHGLRPESRSESRQVAKWARAAGLRTHVLVRTGKAPESDIESAARDARYRLMGERAARIGVKAVYVGHTRDDQAETFLLRLARGSGVDGLAAMRPVSNYPLGRFAGLRLVRPLLGIERGVLQDYLTGRGQSWLDDPMNADPRFARVRIRTAWPVLEAAGLSKARIADAAAHLARARQALDTASQAVLARACRPDQGSVLLDPRTLSGAPRELGLRALSTVLTAVSGNPYRPRFERLERLFDALQGDSLGGGRTLHGCRIGPAPSARAIFGPGTLLVRPEGVRRKTMKNKA